MPPAQLNRDHHQKYFDQKQPTLPEAISFGVHNAFNDLLRADSAKNVILDILKFIIEKFAQAPNKISRIISYRAAKAQTQLEADVFTGISFCLNLYGSIGSDADMDKIGLYLWVFKRMITALEDGTLDGKEGVEENVPRTSEEVNTES